MSSLKKEYTRTIQNIWQAFYDHDEKRIDLIKKEILLRLNKYCEFNNQLIHQCIKKYDNYSEKREEVAKRLIDDYNLPEKIWLQDYTLIQIIPKNRIRIYERYIKNNYCKGIPDERNESELPYGKKAIFYMEEYDDLDLPYIFFGVPHDGEWDLPKMFWHRKFDTILDILYHIEKRKNWREGYFEEKWDNGNLLTAGNYSNGFPNGIWVLRSPDGTKKHFIEWSNGCLNGINYFYYSDTSELGGIEISKNGQLLMSTEHHLDINRIKGKKRYSAKDIVKYETINMLNHPLIVTKKRKHGKFKKGSGNWYFKGEYENNVPIGIWREYLDGKLIYELAYKNGEIDLKNSIFRYKRTGTPIPWNKLK